MKHLKELFILERSDLLQVVVCIICCGYSLLASLSCTYIYTIVKIPCTLYYGKSLEYITPNQPTTVRRSHLGWVTDVLLKMATSYHLPVIQRWNNPQKNHRQLFWLPRAHQCGILLIVSLNDCLQLINQPIGLRLPAKMRPRSLIGWFDTLYTPWPVTFHSISFAHVLCI